MTEQQAKRLIKIGTILAIEAGIALFIILMAMLTTPRNV